MDAPLKVGTFLDWMLADTPLVEREELLAAAEKTRATTTYCDCDPCCPQHCTCPPRALPERNAMSTSTETITVGDLAKELGVEVALVSTRVTQLCKDGIPQQVVKVADWPDARCVLYGTAADEIRAQLTPANP